MKKKDPYFLTFFIFFIIGLLIFILFGFLIFNNYQKMQNGIKTQGRISSITDYDDGDDTSHRVEVQYKVNRKTVSSHLNYYSSSMRVGDYITIYYDKDDNLKIFTPRETNIFIILLILPLTFTLVGGIGLFGSLNNKGLIKSGYLVEASITKVEENKKIMINGVFPFVIYCTYNGLEYKSKNITHDVRKIIEDNGIKTVPLYISKKNEKKYYVDYEDILKRENL